MKLYATITSERATKGQGGKDLRIVITNQYQENICEVNAFSRENGKVFITFVPLDCMEAIANGGLRLNNYTKRYEHTPRVKGGKQTTETDFFNIGVKEADRRKQQRIEKAKRQKGEILPRSRQLKSWPKGV